jgi:hypothetical protein
MKRLLALLCACCGCAGAVRPEAAPAQAASPARYTAHFDTLAPGRFEAFAEARLRYVEALRAAGASDGRGRFFAVDGDSFLTLRPFARFAELDQRRGHDLARLPPAAQEAYDRGSDVHLAFPHHSEIWRRDDDLGYRPSRGALEESDAAVIRMEIEEVRADSTSEAAYDEIWQTTRSALQAADYPLTKIAFPTVFGSGRVISFWLAPSRAALEAASPIDAVLVARLGGSAADALVKRREAIVLRREVHQLQPRPDLASPP